MGKHGFVYVGLYLLVWMCGTSLWAISFRQRLVPQPKSIALVSDTYVALTDRSDVRLFCQNAREREVARLFVQSKMKAWFGVNPKVVAAEEKYTSSEGYRLEVSTNGCFSIRAAGLTGIRYALFSLRQISEPIPGTVRLTGYHFPAVRIEDAPFMTWRGIHFCWFPEYTAVDIERFIRLAASYKMNYIVLESWGMFVSRKYPFLAWPKSPMTVDEVRRLTAIARDLGVTLIPQVNLFGHASGSRVTSGKHATLDFHPAYQPLFEPFGWNWCLSNPETLRLLENLVLEMHDAFGRPGYFHIGCDEALPPTCAQCKQGDYHQRVAVFIRKIHDLLAERSCRTMMWHDMLVSRSDPRWKGMGMVANGNETAERLLDGLPKDIIICDWQYGAANDKNGWPTMKYFKEKGFSVLACPWNVRSGTYSQSAFVRKYGLDGMLATTWHHLHQTRWRLFSDAACAMWQDMKGKPLPRLRDEVLGLQVRQVGWDVPVRDYRDTGILDHQISIDPNGQNW